MNEIRNKWFKKGKMPKILRIMHNIGSESVSLDEIMAHFPNDKRRNIRMYIIHMEKKLGMVKRERMMKGKFPKTNSLSLKLTLKGKKTAKEAIKFIKNENK